MLDKYIDNMKDEIIRKTQELIQIPSVKSASVNSNMPFGIEINNALEYMLELGKSLGFRTKNIDGYCGYIEFGEGEELVGIIGHLDVVPAGDNWGFPAFGGVISNGRIYGRGAIDDKGPVISSLYAMKAVMEHCHVNKRVRLILGLNEENDWNCIKYYKAHEEMPTIGFSPDADFPCIYAEKAVLNCCAKMTNDLSDKSIVIKNIDCNNNPLNVVPKICSTTLRINSKEILMCDFLSNARKIIDNHDFEIDIYKIDEEEVKLTSHGIGAHGAHPDLGVNAISRLIIVLNKLFKTYDINVEIFDFFTKYIGIQYNGENLGINFEDESGKLTLNVGRISLENNVFTIGMNLRVPVTVDIINIGNSFLKYTSPYINVDFDTTHYQPALHLPKNHPLVTTLCEIFNKETNSNLEPIAIGGATFARAFDNCISFGSNFPGHPDMCHQTNEFIEIEHLILSCKIYAKALETLANRDNRDRT